MNQQQTNNTISRDIENFPTNILLALQANGIPCVCDRKKGLVLVLLDGQYGELFSMYAIEGNRIVNNSIYTIKVANNKRHEVEKHLSALNSFFAGSRFYIDSVTRCIAFFSAYRSGEEETKDITNFCLHAYNTCIDNQESLYKLAVHEDVFC